MERVNFKAVALGILADLGGTIVASAVLFAFFAGDQVSDQMSPEEMEEAVKLATQGGAFLITSLVVGLGFSVFGGYVAARVAKKEIYLNAGLVGVASLLIGLFFGGGGPIWFNVAGFLLVIPAALYGGYLADPESRTQP